MTLIAIPFVLALVSALLSPSQANSPGSDRPNTDSKPDHGSPQEPERGPTGPVTLSAILEERKRRFRARFPGSLAPRVSLISACKDRTAYLRTPFVSWRRALSSTDEIVLVDWSTNPTALPIHDLPGLRDDPRVVVIAVANQKNWVLSRAFNLAASFASGRLLLKVDCDTLLGDRFLRVHDLPQNDTLSYFRPEWRRARTQNEQHLNGVFLVRREHFHEVHGFDERLTTYGWDDSDLYNRLEVSLNLIPRPIDFNTLEHIEHADTLRSANQQNSATPILQTQINSIGLAELPPWENDSEWKDRGTRYTYSVVSRSLITANATADIPGLVDRLTPDQLRDIRSKARNRVLHDIYGIPWDVMSQVEASLDSMLAEFQTLYPRGWLRNAGAIYAELHGSEATRLLCLSSSVALAKRYKRPLFVAWGETDGSNSLKLSDFFNPDLVGGHGSEAERNRSELVLFSLRQMKCTRSVEVCQGWDQNYAHFREFDPSESKSVEDEITRVLEGRVSAEEIDRRHILLRFSKAPNFVSRLARGAALATLVPSLALGRVINSFGEVKGSMAIYVGKKLTKKALPAVTKRILVQARHRGKVFVLGEHAASVSDLRQRLGDVAVQPTGEEPASSGPKSRTMLRVAEIYVMGAMCNAIIRDAMCPDDVKELVETVATVKKTIMIAAV